MDAYQERIDQQRQFFHSGKTKDLSFRKEALKKLKAMVLNYEPQINEALKQDLNKSEYEAFVTEIGVLIEEINFMLKHLDRWAQPRAVKASFMTIGSKSMIYPEPYGVVLVIAPWNYPYHLAIAPIIGAIAAGNCVMLKPSELTPRTSALLVELIQKVFLPEYISVVEGGIEVSTSLLEKKFDYIFFTGSVPVGKIVMTAAAKHLTPVTLELGGKSPCIVHEDANLSLAAKRIVWGKFINAGQTCVAPDYLYVQESIKERLLEKMKKAIEEIYGDRILEEQNFTRIVSEKHFERLQHFLSNGEIIVGGRADRQTLLIEPTLLEHISWKDEVMQDEIFGPILPVLTFRTLGEVIAEVNQRPKPLALYLFTEDPTAQEFVLGSISFGGGCINDTLMHLSSPHLPFGGVGESGIGAYHGKGSFDTFSHEKSILKQTTRFDIPLRYPQVKNGLKKLRWFVR
ncbi:aldehyde dehydrogenase [Ammoniphilus sp. YIM 78166]|uniref:aldehyde dehydrogenase n=1 Tax=Ammoniphilus sp. YIM 78166 TaxID=1644106 RepID=UPI00107002A1|nr:aldehyde dehydrogenase [Ammoniphilus sp. YIM 78166]